MNAVGGMGLVLIVEDDSLLVAALDRAAAETGLKTIVVMDMG